MEINNFSQRPFAASSLLAAGNSYKIAAVDIYVVPGSAYSYVGLELEGHDRKPGLRSLLSKGQIGQAVTFKGGRMTTAKDTIVARNDGPFVQAFKDWLVQNPTATNQDVCEHWTKELAGKYLNCGFGSAIINEYNKVRCTLSLSISDEPDANFTKLTAEQETALQYASI